MQLPHIILETANFHGGKVDLILQAIEIFSRLDYTDKGIKFHAFHPDKVALNDFSWYQTIKRFYITEENWVRIIKNAANLMFKVWLDIFCVYGVKILRQNLDLIHGIKIQPSILPNLEIQREMNKLALHDKEIIINVSGLEIKEVAEYLKKYELLKIKKIVIQAGYQNFPTKIGDSSLSKLKILKETFPDYELAYADHLDAELPIARYFPVYCWLRGCGYLEKHVCVSREETEFDKESALDFSELSELTNELKLINRTFKMDFIVDKEREYYEKSIQKPILKNPLNKGQLVAVSDLTFRRTDQSGLNYNDLMGLQNNFQVLSRNLSYKRTIKKSDFKKARIAVIVAARMKSSRLKQKALLPIGGMPSIERCLDYCLKFPFSEQVILATSTLKEDSVMTQYTLKGRVKLWRGEADDVISRYLGACKKYNIDVIIRVTGDCPVVSPEIAEYLLRCHFEVGADFTDAKDFCVGTNSQIYNVEALRRIKLFFKRADYSEHMTYYITNNPHVFKINRVDLPEKWIRNYRLTLDYQEDLDMFNELFKKIKEKKINATIENIFKILDDNPQIAEINAHKSQVYHTDKELIAKLKKVTRMS